LYPSERSDRISLSGNDGERKIWRSKFLGAGPAIPKETVDHDLCLPAPVCQKAPEDNSGFWELLGSLYVDRVFVFTSYIFHMVACLVFISLI